MNSREGTTFPVYSWKNLLFNKVKLRKNNLGVNVHYIPVYYHPYYQNLGYQKGIYPNAEWLYERIITIPLYPKMTEEQVKKVITRIKKVINNELI